MFVQSEVAPHRVSADRFAPGEVSHRRFDLRKGQGACSSGLPRGVVTAGCCEFCKGHAVAEQNLRMWRRDSEPLYGIQSSRQLCAGHARHINAGGRLSLPSGGDPRKDMLFRMHDQQACQREHDTAVAETERRNTYRLTDLQDRLTRERAAQRETYCWGCKSTLSSALHPACPRCRWLTCPRCNACSWFCK